MSFRYLSLCSGIEAASVAWMPLGWKAVAFAEIEPFPAAVLARHYPGVPNLGDMTKVHDWRLYRGTVDLVVGGTPCQDFSVAGKRAGLAGGRGGLALVFTQILSVVRPEWVVWENVPGVFSTNGGRDFGAFIGALDDIGYSCAWRVLDAQYFGLPQRRRRVYVVGYFGDWRPAAAVLFEPGCLCRNTPARGKKRTAIAQRLAGRPGDGGPDDNAAGGGVYLPRITGQAVSCKWAKGTSGPAGNEYHNLIAAPLNARPYADNAAQESRLVVSQYGDKAAALTCEGADGSPCADRGPTVIAFYGSHARNQDREHCLAFTERGRAEGRTLEYQEEQAYCLMNPGGGGRTHSRQIMTPQLQVRRLTPRECERLQGFPDDYTAIEYRGRPAADAPRYRAIGNSMAVNVMRWIGERIDQARTRLSPKEKPGCNRA